MPLVEKDLQLYGMYTAAEACSSKASPWGLPLTVVDQQPGR
jgi:hypothetical protein